MIPRRQKTEEILNESDAQSHRKSKLRHENRAQKILHRVGT